jgi:cold shock CspA family protein
MTATTEEEKKTTELSDSNLAPKRLTGTVTKWLNHRGIGFITPDGQTSEVGKDLLVHYSHVKQGNETAYVTLLEGSKVEFEMDQDPKNPDKMIAVRVTGVGGGECEKKDRHHRDDRYIFNRKYKNQYGKKKDAAAKNGTPSVPVAPVVSSH